MSAKADGCPAREKVIPLLDYATFVIDKMILM